jgi:hypothetical protein
MTTTRRVTTASGPKANAEGHHLYKAQNDEVSLNKLSLLVTISHYKDQNDHKLIL